MGCVIAELVLNRPIFTGKSATDQLLEIIKVLGTPTFEQMKAMKGKMINSSKLPKYEKKPWKDVFKDKCNDELFMDLVENLLVYEPLKRFKPYQALCHPFFDELKQKVSDKLNKVDIDFVKDIINQISGCFKKTSYICSEEKNYSCLNGLVNI